MSWWPRQWRHWSVLVCLFNRRAYVHTHRHRDEHAHTHTDPNANIRKSTHAHTHTTHCIPWQTYFGFISPSPSRSHWLVMLFVMFLFLSTWGLGGGEDIKRGSSSTSTIHSSSSSSRQQACEPKQPPTTFPLPLILSCPNCG